MKILTHLSSAANASSPFHHYAGSYGIASRRGNEERKQKRKNGKNSTAVIWRVSHAASYCPFCPPLRRRQCGFSEPQPIWNVKIFYPPFDQTDPPTSHSSPPIRCWGGGRNSSSLISIPLFAVCSSGSCWSASRCDLPPNSQKIDSLTFSGWKGAFFWCCCCRCYLFFFFWDSWSPPCEFVIRVTRFHLVWFVAH